MKPATALSLSKARCGSEPVSARPSDALESGGPARRRFLAGAIGAAVAAPLLGAPAIARALRGTRRFDLYRDGDLIGFHTLSASRDGDTVRMAIDIEIAVKFLGFTAYRYEHQNRETWVAGRLQSLTSTTNDDGEPASCSVERQGDQLLINGRPAPDAAPTSYWNAATLQRQPWFSTQSGKILDLNFQTSPSGGGKRVDVSGNFETTLFYDAAGEWRGCQFDGSGELITYKEVAPGPSFMDFLA